MDELKIKLKINQREQAKKRRKMEAKKARGKVGTATTTIKREPVDPVKQDISPVYLDLTLDDD